MSYIVGIDLGTTNTVVFFLDKNGNEKPQCFKIPQLVNSGEIESLSSLASCIYVASDTEMQDNSLVLPWHNKSEKYVVGAFASKVAAERPAQVVSSAKSWLCAENIDRGAKVLPIEQDDLEFKISPIEASSLILKHVRDAWNHQFGKSALFEEQQIIITVPASFDAVARELTVKAASEVGLKDVLLLEEPQAAFYSWLNKHENWRKSVMPGDLVLVCDIGGGTTDFSLIEAKENAGELLLERSAVGRHILLGGDNLDLTMAYMAQAKFKKEHGIVLSKVQFSGLMHSCRYAKEKLLADASEESCNLTVLGSGSSVIGGSVTITLSRTEVETMVLDGFFPKCEIGEELKRSNAGLKTFGLKYEVDPAITKHLSDFILNNVENTGMPSCILFNGGISKSTILRERILATIDGWLEADSPKLRILPDGDADMAVAYGACCYGEVKSGKGIRVKSGSAQAYYVAIESSMPAIPGFTPPLEAVCVVPFGMEEGSEYDVNTAELGLIVGDCSEFTFFASANRQNDKIGDVIENITADNSLIKLPVMTTTLEAFDTLSPGSMLAVKLRSVLTETGTLQLWCTRVNQPEQKWKLEFDLRSGK